MDLVLIRLSVVGLIARTCGISSYFAFCHFFNPFCSFFNRRIYHTRSARPIFHNLLIPPTQRPNNIMSAEEVAQAFVQHFYQAFDSNVDSLAGLFVSLLLLVLMARTRRRRVGHRRRRSSEG